MGAPSAAARSTTMMLAMEPVMVSTPRQQVDAIASASQPACGSEKLTTSARNSITTEHCCGFDRIVVTGKAANVGNPRWRSPSGTPLQSRAMRARHDDEEPHEEHQQSPVDLVTEVVASSAARTES